MSLPPLAQWAADSAVANADLGARVALQVCKEQLRLFGLDDAAELLEECGERAVAQAFATLSWEEESISTTPNGNGNLATAKGEERT